jgi:hypothetical protein
MPVCFSGRAIPRCDYALTPTRLRLALAPKKILLLRGSLDLIESLKAFPHSATLFFSAVSLLGISAPAVASCLADTQASLEVSATNRAGIERRFLSENGVVGRHLILPSGKVLSTFRAQEPELYRSPMEASREQHPTEFYAVVLTVYCLHDRAVIAGP